MFAAQALDVLNPACIAFCILFSSHFR